MLLCLWDFPGKSTGMGCHFLLQGIFLTQGSNPGLLHCRQTLYPLSHQGSPRSYIATKSLQSCPTLVRPHRESPVPGILQARTLECVAISLWKEKGKSLSRVRLLATPCTAAYQAPLSVGFSKQEYWSGVPLLSPVLYWLCLKNRSICCYC